MVHPARYTENDQLLKVLQQLQVLLPCPHATLADVSTLLQHVKSCYGETACLEDVIQSLVVQNLERQCFLAF